MTPEEKSTAMKAVNDDFLAEMKRIDEEFKVAQTKMMDDTKKAREARDQKVKVLMADFIAQAKGA